MSKVRTKVTKSLTWPADLLPHLRCAILTLVMRLTFGRLHLAHTLFFPPLDQGWISFFFFSCQLNPARHEIPSYFKSLLNQGTWYIFVRSLSNYTSFFRQKIEAFFIARVEVRPYTYWIFFISLSTGWRQAATLESHHPVQRRAEREETKSVHGRRWLKREKQDFLRSRSII